MAEEADLLARLSAWMDDEGPDPGPLEGEAANFAATALRIRQIARVEEAATPPDVTAAVLDRVASATPAPRRQVLLVAGLAFLLAALGAALLANPTGRSGTQIASADVGERLLRAQAQLDQMDATVILVEQGAHPDLPIRRYEGTMRYRAPEQLWLSLSDTSALPEGWPPNDIDLQIDNGVVSRTGLRNCPLSRQPGCLGQPDTRVTVGVPPFASDVQAPLDLIIPVGGVVRGDEVAAAAVVWRDQGDTVQVVSTVAAVEPLIDTLTGNGAVRQVYVGDSVQLSLDADTLALRGLTVRAGSSAGRAGWAAANSYADEPGDLLLDLRVLPQAAPIPAPPRIDVTPERDAGFVDGPVHDDVQIGELPSGFTLHREGTVPRGEPGTTQRAYSDGRAWLSLESSTDWAQPRLLGDVGALVRPVPVGDGIGYTTPEGDAVAVHAAGVDVLVRGTVALDTLIQVAQSLTSAGVPVRGIAIPEAWQQADLLTELPAGALRPPGPLTARQQADGTILVAVPGTGSSGALLSQRPGMTLPPPVKGDVVEVTVRGRPGRWSAPLGQLEWQESGWILTLSRHGLDQEDLIAVAQQLVGS